MRKILLILTPLLFFYCSKEDETSKSNLEESKTENIDKKSNFSLQVFSSNGGGVSSEGGVFKEGTKVKLTAFPDTNYVFSHWSNGVEESRKAENLGSRGDVNGRKFAESTGSAGPASETQRKPLSPACHTAPVEPSIVNIHTFIRKTTVACAI